MSIPQKSNVERLVVIRNDIEDLGLRLLTISNSRFDLYPVSDTRYGLIAYSNRLAAKINKVLKYYPEDTKFLSGEEPVFKFTSDRLPELSKLLRIKLGK